jgi:NADH:ubiquinone oxidoreductase subunit 5 (subunit L)/multisubunit Na+/H+ antiporter MnhA subunit
VLPATTCWRTHRRGVPWTGCVRDLVGAHVGAAVAGFGGRFHRVAVLLKKPALADSAERSFKWLHTILVNKYGFDWFNEHVIVPSRAALGAAVEGGR